MNFDYRTQNYFPSHILLVGYALILLGLLLLVVNWVGAIGAIFIGVFIITTKYGMSLDLENCRYHDYLFVLGLKTGSKSKFDKVENLFINSGKKTTKMQLRANSSDITELEYNGYIKFTDDEKVHLISSIKKEDVKKLLLKMSLDLSVALEDYSDK